VTDFPQKSIDDAARVLTSKEAQRDLELTRWLERKVWYDYVQSKLPTKKQHKKLSLLIAETEARLYRKAFAKAFVPAYRFAAFGL